ncbi:golgin subfamily A member 4 isoform X2 [Hyla sarda]|uniref:golgin subfamily A member 4 isoform X2 n=1 Tax=Hyla sarda TaxID=327740 RepID=UPI0024C31496|nr:golgin subfamily A member 4 isoform X2 [Hyla sarda]
MFKKLKQKIIEEQSPVRSSLHPQAQGQSGNRSRTSSTDQQDDSMATPDKELLAGMIAEPALLSEYTIFALDHTKRSRPQSGSVNVSGSADNMNGNDPISSQKNEPQSFAQKLQLRVPSMESLFRSPVKETLFRSSSKESLVRSGSRDSLNRIDGDTSMPLFDPSSDIESEAEDALGGHEGLTKEQLFHRLHRMEKSLGNYRGKYSEIVTAYRTVQRDKEKLQSILSQSQDKALRRIGELREELQMDQQAKKHLQEEFDASLEEKDQLISVLQTQVTLLKQRFGKGQEPEASVTSSETENQSTGQEAEADSIPTPDVSIDGANTLDALQVRVKRQENLLQRCKEMIRTHKEKCAQLSSEKEALQNQLEERLQELEKVKELHTSEKTKLITQLRDAKNLVEQLEQDKGMVIAETKRQMHETLMIKEEEVSQLRTRVKHLTSKCEQLQEQKEKSEKAAFEQLEKAVSASQSTEDAHKKGKQEMEEHIKAIEQASEEERMKIQKELSRVKQEVVDIMKKSCDERIHELEKLHAESLKTKEQEHNETLKMLEEEYQEKLKNTFTKSQEEHLNAVQEKEQQALLALEEMELQKKAIQTQTENQLQEMQQELEECRTRILELESFLAKTSQDSDTKSEELFTRLESETNKHNAEITAIIEKHKQELELCNQDSEKNLVEKLESLRNEHRAEIAEIKEKCQQECDTQLKEKERAFQAHIEEMNEKTLEKLDIKQTELEALSSELSEALKLCQENEEKLLECQNERDKIKLEYEGQFVELQKQHHNHIDAIEKEKEILTQGVEKDLKEEINHLKLLLDGNKKEMEHLQLENEQLKDAVKKADMELKTMTVQLDELHGSYQKKAQEKIEHHTTEIKNIQEKLNFITEERNQLKQLVEDQESKLKLLTAELDTYKEQVQSLNLKIEQQATLVNDLSLQSETKINEYKSQVDELNRVSADKENEIQKLKDAHNHLINQLKENVSSKEKKIESLQEDYKAKAKSQDNKIEKMKQRLKEMQETSKKKYSEMESKLKKELEKKQLELDDKEKQFNDKMLEMAHASSAGINDALSQLEQNHKEQIVSVKEAHQRELQETAQNWEKKFSLQVEELKEKHEAELQEKDQEITEITQRFSDISKEKEEVDKDIIALKEEKNSLDITFLEFQEKLKEMTVQVLSLTQSEKNVKSELEKLQNERVSLVNEKNMVDSELIDLKASVEANKSEINSLLDKLCKTEERCQSLEMSLSDESATLAKEWSEKLLEKDAWCRKLQLEHEQKFGNFCKEAVSLLESLTSGLSSKYNDHINRLLLKVSICEKAASKLKEPIAKQVGKIQDLEMQINQLFNDYTTVNASLTQSSQNLHEKENMILVLKEELKTVSIEKETLQKEGGNQQKVADEKESCITQLKKELSENINTVTSLTAALKERDTEVNELKLKLENSLPLEEKEKAIAFISSQHNESQQQLLKQIQDLTSNIKDLNKEKAASVKEADKLKNKLDEWKKKAEVRFTQNHQTIKDLQEKTEIANKQLIEKDGEIKTAKEEFEHFRNNIAKDQASRESLALELTTNIERQNSKIQELEAEVETLTKEKQCLIEEVERQIQQQSIEKSHLVEQLSHIQNISSENDSHSMEAQQQILRLENEISSLKEDSNAKLIQWEQLKVELTESKDKALKTLEEQLTSESAKKIADLKKKAEQKIASVKKQLMSQLEEKEKSKLYLEEQLQSLKNHLHKEGQALQASLIQEKEELEKNNGILQEQHLHKDNELFSLRDELLLKEKKIKELEDLNETSQQKLNESERIINDKELSLITDKEAEKLRLEQLSAKHQEDLLSLQEQLAVKDSELKACNEKLVERLKSYQELKILFDEIQSQENTLKAKFQEAEGEIQKLRKEVTRLQKDLRTLRKEHNQELDLLKKELQEEAEQKIKYEQEDQELKHNSSLKQLMREFNTQMAQKERELEIAVQETIGKAQEVEAEILQSHHIETTQLHKKIAEKEDDLKRTVKKYEEILEAREEEMTAKVTELQEQLEKMQEELSKRQEEEAAQEAEDKDQGEIQAQLAKKTTQLNDAKLKEQELKEKINTLEDQLKNYSHGVFVTPLGTPYKGVNHRYTDVSGFGEPTEFEYLRKVLFEYMMGRETKTMAKVITMVLKFPADQAQKILEREESRPVSWLRSSS